MLSFLGKMICLFEHPLFEIDVAAFLHLFFGITFLFLFLLLSSLFFLLFLLQVALSHKHHLLIYS